MGTTYCCQCVHFCSLHIKRNYQFFLYELGYCYKQNKLVDMLVNCEFWEKREKQKTITPEVLNRALTDLEKIKIILQEETERINKK